MIVHKGYIIRRDHILPSMWSIDNENGGNLPESLKGQWSAASVAQTAIETHLATKAQKEEERKASRSKPKKPQVEEDAQSQTDSQSDELPQGEDKRG